MTGADFFLSACRCVFVSGLASQSSTTSILTHLWWYSYQYAVGTYSSPLLHKVSIQFYSPLINAWKIKYF